MRIKAQPEKYSKELLRSKMRLRKNVALLRKPYITVLLSEKARRMGCKITVNDISETLARSQKRTIKGLRKIKNQQLKPTS